MSTVSQNKSISYYCCNSRKILGIFSYCFGLSSVQISYLQDHKQFSWKGPCSHCVKSVQIRSFFWSVLSPIWTEHPDLFHKSPYLVQMRGNTDQTNSIFGHFSRSVFGGFLGINLTWLIWVTSELRHVTSVWVERKRRGPNDFLK